MPQAKALVRAYARSAAQMEVSSDGAELVLVVPHLPRGFLQDLGGEQLDILDLQCASSVAAQELLANGAVL